MPGVQRSQKAWEIAKKTKKNENLQRQEVQAQREMDPGSSKRIRDVGWIQEAKTLDPKHQNTEEHDKAWAHTHVITGEGITAVGLIQLKQTLNPTVRMKRE
jgi:hypothetical protein